MIDMADERQLRDFLFSHKIVSPAGELLVKYMGGGISSTVALAKQGETLLIVKQALETLKVAELWNCNPGRILVEKNALEIYGKLVPDCVPGLVYYDDENYIMVREAVSEDWCMWKTQLLEGIFDYEVAKKAVMALVTVHNATAGDLGVKELFKDNQYFYELRISPYIEQVVKKYPRLKEKADKVIHMLMNEHIALIHGDYSPKNILVDHSQICILDLEVAYYGHPSFDLAFFSNHFFLKAFKNPQWTGQYLDMLDYMTEIYFQNVTCCNGTVLEKQTIQVLAFLLLARIDGKSKIEYLTEENQKNQVRKLGFLILEKELSSYQQVFWEARALCGQEKGENGYE